jgi:hypothetical protein
MVGPKYSEPDAAMAPGFKETAEWKEGDGWKVAQPNDAALPGKWWELYPEVMQVVDKPAIDHLTKSSITADIALNDPLTS